MTPKIRPSVVEQIKILQSRLELGDLNPRAKLRIEDGISRLEGQLNGGGEGGFGLPKFQEPEKLSLRQRMDIFFRER